MHEEKAYVKVDEQIFTAPAYGPHGTSDQRGRLDGERPAQGLAHTNRVDAGASDAISKTAAGDFNFR